MKSREIQENHQKAEEKCYRIENKKKGVLLTDTTKQTNKQTRGQFQGGINLLFPKDSQDIRINEPYGSKGLMSCLFLIIK